MNESLVAVALIGLLAGGAIVVVDSLIIRRIRRLAPPQQRDGDGDQPRQT